VLCLFNAGSDQYRSGSKGPFRKFLDDPAAMLWPPWQVLQSYVSRNSDEHLYYDYTQLARGLPVSSDEVAQKRTTSVESLRIADRPGWRMPYRDFSVEYPPLVWAAILPPSWVVHSLHGYRLAFGLWAGLLTLAAAVAAVRLRRQREPGLSARLAYRRVTWLLLAIGPLLAIRFDILPALLTILAVERTTARRWGWAGLALGLGAAAKIYPAVLLPQFALAALGSTPPGRRWRAVWRLVAGTGAAVAITCAPFLLTAGHGFLSDMNGHALRPLEVESVLATPLLFLRGVHTFFGFGCLNLAAPGAETAAWLSGPLAVLLLGLAGAITYRLARFDLHRAVVEGTTLALLGLLCAAKVLSPQYLIWLVPLVLALPGRTGRWLSGTIGVAAILAQVWYPTLWSRLEALRLDAVVMVACRNLILVVSLLFLARALVRAKSVVPTSAHHAASATSDQTASSKAVPG
jgi:hypothetical protein